MQTLNLIHTKNLFILDQLKLEEFLLKKNDEQSFCIINEGSKKAIVLGLCNKKEKMIDFSLLKRKKVPIIKRFTAGGTVIVDKNTIFITFIFSKKLLNFSFPEEIFKWSEQFYKNIFPYNSFSLIENDYVIKNFKCAGNAQYIKKKKWLHHTSFLWDFEKENMNLLLLPERTPKYRNKREHVDFLYKLKHLFDKKENFISKVVKDLEKKFIVKNFSIKTKKASRQSYNGSSSFKKIQIL